MSQVNDKRLILSSTTYLYYLNELNLLRLYLFFFINILIGPSGSQAIGSPFGYPDLMQRLEANPKTREYLKQPDYRMMIQLLQQNPNHLQYVYY
jgi:hypothetical protein